MEIPILIRETIGTARENEPLRIGVPIPRGNLQDLHCLSLVDSSGNAIPFDSRPLGRWGDGSIKWLLLDFAATLPASGGTEYRLRRAGCRGDGLQRKIRIVPGVKEWAVMNGDTIYAITTDVLRPFSSVMINNHRQLSANAGCLVGMPDNGVLQPRIESICVEQEGALRSTIRLQGRFGAAADETCLRFLSRISFFAGNRVVVFECTLRNPNASRHPNGLWDLGDPASRFLSQFILELPLLTGRKIICSPDAGSSPVISEGRLPETLRIQQHSSGGDNWNSPTHVTADGKIPFTHRGAELSMGPKKKPLLRPSPVIWCGDGPVGTAGMIPHFWQNFPAALQGGAEGLRFEFLPPLPSALHELQGGEQKTFLACFAFGAPPSALDWMRAPLLVTVDPEACRNSGAIPDLPPSQNMAAVDIFDQFIKNPEEMQAKREAADEYGWRNFGDVYADHEAVNREQGSIFISHYNNQYDICSGLYRKFLATGLPEWRELAADLARHIIDIDIYHTEKDREEYNNGMFWHTDHYLPAATSSHRSFSRDHLAFKKGACGGGPGAEHCYTSGLLLHYFITGNPDFREAVIGLADWSLRALKGPQTILSSLRKAGRYVRHCRNCGAGNAVAFPRYPLTRGTGNTIVACLDALAAGGGEKYLRHARALIRGALHPHDDIAARNLADAETAWSYTVLLAAVAKYLDVKRDLEELDEDFEYARHALLAYGDWMLRNEYLYLEKPEILEFPNETWAAQELRKAVVLYHAARFSPPEKSGPFLEKAQYFYNSSLDQLRLHSGSTLTRPLALMLQNGWVGEKLATLEPDSRYGNATSWYNFGPPTPSLSYPAVISRIGVDLSLALRETNLKREYAWLKSRLGL